MTAKDQLKLLKAGFTIIRKENIKGTAAKIKMKTPDRHEWYVHRYYETKAEMERAANELLKLSMIVED